MPFAIDESCRRRLDDIEYAEQQECESLAQWIRAHEKKHEQERGNLVPYDRGVVRDAEVASGSIRGPDPDRERRSDDEYESEIIGKGPQQCGERERDERPDRARRDWRQASAEPQSDEVRGMRKQKPERWRFPHRVSFLSRGNDRMPPASFAMPGRFRRVRAVPRALRCRRCA